MAVGKAMTGLGLGAIIAAGLVASPALLARETRQVQAAKRLARPEPSIGSFTPASADPRLAALLARTGLNATGFRFTPSEREATSSRAVTVAVRARSVRGPVVNDRLAAVQQAPALAPIAYNLGMSVGWKRFAVSGDLAKLDLAGQPGSRERVGVGVSYTGRKFVGQVNAGSERPLADQPKLVSDNPSYSIDVGGSYSLTRNLDVTAGVRYRSDKERLLRLAPDRRDSQAVYLGTAFRF